MKRTVIVALSLILLASGLGINSFKADAAPQASTDMVFPLAAVEKDCKNVKIDVTFVYHTVAPVSRSAFNLQTRACSKDGSIATVSGTCGTTSFFLGGRQKEAPPEKPVLTGDVMCWPEAPIRSFVQTTMNQTYNDQKTFFVAVQEMVTRPVPLQGRSVTFIDGACRTSGQLR